jgi:hypothetical protein
MLDRADARHPASRSGENIIASPELVPGTRSNMQAWAIDSSHRVPDTHMLGGRYQVVGRLGAGGGFPQRSIRASA